MKHQLSADFKSPIRRSVRNIRKRNGSVILLPLLFVLIIAQTACSADREPVSREEFMLDTICSISIYEIADGEGKPKAAADAKDECGAAMDRAYDRCRELEDLISRTRENSDISRLNEAGGEWVSVGSDVLSLIKEGVRYSELTDGAFDITVGGVTELWDFHAPEGEEKLPDDAAIKEALSHVGYKNVEIEDNRDAGAVNVESAVSVDEEGAGDASNKNDGEVNGESVVSVDEEGIGDASSESDSNVGGESVVSADEEGTGDASSESDSNVGGETAGHAGRVRLRDPDAKVDLGAIAKGYIGDVMRAELEDAGVTSGIINLGGNVICIGGKPGGEPFVIGVETPFSDRTEIVGRVEASGQTLVTSGIYERKIEVAGRIYHHVLDTKTGYPAETDLSGVTLISDGRSMDADALSTICLIKGYDEARKLIGETDGIEAVFVKADGSVEATAGANFRKE